MSTLQELLERVEKATGPDREIDAAIASILLGWTYQKFKGDARQYWRTAEDSKPETYYRREDHPPAYTSSIDAAVGLVERMLPELWWKVARGCKCDAGHRYYGFVFGALDWGKPTQRSIGYWEGTRDLIECSGATPALALIAALLRAMIASKP